MRALFLLICCVTILISGCDSQTKTRADYIRATLPYEAKDLVVGAQRIRRMYPDVSDSTMASVDQQIIEHLLRLYVCLSDPHISEKDKKYAREVLPAIVAYVAKYDIHDDGFRPGVEYDMLPGDFVLPPKMKIRDVLDELIKQQK
jgi:hypothetical protein